MTSYRVIKGFSLDSIESKPLAIVRQILASTLIIEALGRRAVFRLPAHRPGSAGFTAVFHSISPSATPASQPSPRTWRVTLATPR